MNPILAYILGFITIPVLIGVGWAINHVMVKFHWKWECAVCGASTPEGKILRSMVTQAYHAIFIYPRKAHRDALEKWQIKWGYKEPE